MAAAPVYYVTPHNGVASVATVTDRTITAAPTDILTGVAAGTKVNEIVVKATGDLADSVVLIFAFNGTSYFLIDEFDVGDPAASSNTVVGYRERRVYDNLVLPSASWKIAAGITVAPTAGVCHVWVLGADA